MRQSIRGSRNCHPRSLRAVSLVWLDKKVGEGLREIDGVKLPLEREGISVTLGVFGRLLLRKKRLGIMVNYLGSWSKE